jgi:hypothetical protein
MKKLTALALALLLAGGMMTIQAGPGCGGCPSKAKADKQECGTKVSAEATATGSKTCVIDGKSVECTTWSDGTCSPTEKASAKAACRHEGDCTAACAPKTMSSSSCSSKSSCAPDACGGPKAAAKAAAKAAKVAKTS